MKKLLFLILLLFPIFGQVEYSFSDNFQITDSSGNQKFPEVIINNETDIRFNKKIEIMINKELN